MRSRRGHSLSTSMMCSVRRARIGVLPGIRSRRGSRRRRGSLPGVLSVCCVSSLQGEVMPVGDYLPPTLMTMWALAERCLITVPARRNSRRLLHRVHPAFIVVSTVHECSLLSKPHVCYFSAWLLEARDQSPGGDKTTGVVSSTAPGMYK